jgi:hypothetical protein
MNFDAWRPFIAKLLAPLIGGIALWIKGKIGADFGVDEQNVVTQGIVDFIVFAITAGASGVGINKFVNPGNAASSHLAAVEKAETEQIKRSDNGK